MTGDTLHRTASALHTLFFADAEAAARLRALREALHTDAELGAFDAIHVALINFEPPPPDVLAAARKLGADLLARETVPPPRMSGRLTVVPGNNGADAAYAARLLTKMYANWDGTLDYERGLHRFMFYSPFDEQMRRVAVCVAVAVDGEGSQFQTRDYVLGPYLLVKDRRTLRESEDPWRVLGGDLSLILPDSAPGLDSDPDAGGASPEGNDGGPGAGQ